MKRSQTDHHRQAVIYARVSSKEQEKEGYSIPAQQKLLRGYAAEKGFNVAQEFVDVETARRAGRTAFNDMVRFLKRTPGCKVVLVEKTDRLYRNFKDYVTVDELDLEVHFVKENSVLSRDSRSSEKFVHGIKVLMAKNYIDNLSEETRKGMDQKAEEGHFPSRAPLGYRNVVGPGGRKTIEPDPEHAPLVARVFEWYASGLYSLDQVTRLAHDAGFVYRKSRKPVSRAALHKLLTNRIFTGKFSWKGKVYQGTYPPLVSEEVWEKVQALLRQRRQAKTRQAKHDLAFARLVRCGHCGCALVGEEKKGRYVYYHCTGFRAKNGAQPKCPEPYVREEALGEAFTGALRRLAFDDEVLGLVREALRQSHRDARRFHEEAVARLRAEHTKLQGRLDAMYVDKLDGKVEAGFYERKQGEWREEQARLGRQIEHHQRANQTYLEEGIQLMELARRAADLFAAQEPREKRRLLDFVVSNCAWAGGRLEVQFKQPFDMLAVANESLKAEQAAGGVPSGLRPEKLPVCNTLRTTL